MEPTNSGQGSPLANSVQAARDGLDAANTWTHNAIDEAAHAVQPEVARLAREADAVVDRLASAGHSLDQTLESSRRSAENTARRLTTEGRDYIGRHPWATLGIALVTGFLASRLMRRR